MNATDASDREIATTRIFDPPRELVFRVWTDPEHVANWWGPTGFSITTKQMDVRPGGEWLFTMHGPDGTDYPNRILYREIVPPERIVYSHTGESAGGDTDVHFDTTVLFTDRGGRTEVSMRALFHTKAARDMAEDKYGAVEGMHQTLGRMGEYLREAGRVLSTTRFFPAKRGAVYSAFSDSGRLARWWGPKGFTNTFDTFEFRPGGVWKFIMHGPDGNDYMNESRFIETGPERIVLDHLTGHGFQMRIFLDDMGERTRLTWQLCFASEAECVEAKHIVAPANEQNLDRLEEELGLR